MKCGVAVVTSRLCTLLAALVTVIGVVSGVIALWEFAVRFRRRTALTWGDIQPSMDDLIERVRQDVFDPEVVLGIGRGGAIVAAMVATRLKQDERFVFVDTMSESLKHGRKRVSIRFPESVPDLAGKRVLIVVGELYMGLDLDAAIEFVEARQAAAIRTLTLLAGPTTIVKPDLCGIATKHAPLAPWRITDAGKGGRL